MEMGFWKTDAYSASEPRTFRALLEPQIYHVERIFLRAKPRRILTYGTLPATWSFRLPTLQ